MRAVLFICACVCVVVGQDINAMKNMPKYDARYDYLDVDAILDSKRLVRNYVECLINVQRCTPEGKALKRILPEALRTKCVRCTDRQKKTAVKVIKRLKYEYPEEWSKLSSRWDPTGDFTRYFEEFLAKDNFNSLYGNDNGIPGSSPPAPPPVPATLPPAAQPPVEDSTPPRPVILNRFGDEAEEEMVGSPSSAAVTPAQTMPPTRTSPPPTTRPVIPITMRPRPPVNTWTGAASDAMPTRFPMRPFPNMPVYTTAITLIDQISYKIMRTTELVTDILRNTVRAVVGR